MEMTTVLPPTIKGEFYMEIGTHNVFTDNKHI